MQSDWNQNNSADRQYIQNRVCYTGDPVDTQIFSGTVASGETYFELGAPSDFDSLEDGKEITLVIDGVTYNETLTLDVSNGIYWCGNGSIWEYGEDTGESYIVQIEETGVYGDFAEAFDHDVAITISTGISEIHTLDDKYLNGALLKRGTGRYSVILNGEDTHLEASGYGAVAEGEYATASSSNAHAEGYYTTASGNTSHAEGSSTTASGTSSHAEGNATAASGSYSHAEGNYSVASGVSSHAEGYYNTATGHSSHAEGGHSNSAVLKSSFGIYLTGDANATTYTVDSVTVYLCSLVGFYIGSSRIVSETINSAGAI